MIKKIHLLKDFGVFSDFKWNTLPELNQKNIFYGWNYTGKTTLSKIFTSLRDNETPSSFNGCDFKLILTDNSEITKANISTNELDVIVFNSDYIRENLKWDTDSEIDGITFDVGENVTIREKIENFNKQIDKVNGTDTLKSKKEPFQEIVSEFDSFENQKFTAEARNIKNDVFNSLIEFNKGHLKIIKNQVQFDLSSNIISDQDELNKVKKISLASNDKEPIDKIDFLLNIEPLYVETQRLLKEEPEKKDIIELLDSNTQISNWVKTGLPFHEDASNCHFCDNPLSSERLNLLNAYFSNASSILREKLTEQSRIITDKIEELNTLNLPKSKFDFFENYQDKYEKKIKEFEAIKLGVIDVYNFLKTEIGKKSNSNIFVSQLIDDFNDESQITFNNWLKEINEIIASHNDFIENFNDKQDEARTLLKKHQVASFLDKENYIEKENSKEYANRCIYLYDRYVQKLNEEILKAEAELKSIVKGQEELNSFITKFLNRTDIKIEVVNEDKFILKRGEKIAKNLSEGEKTAISFSYFLVTLESLFRENKLFDYIIFVDDPISSLDGNHIAQVYSLINSFFFRQNINPDDANQYVNCFKQLFLSTHNFEFFSFLKDSNRLNKKNTKQYYFIKRISENQSTIQELPKSLRDYKSEYIYLFDIIYNFYDSGCQESDEKYILLPNAVRRFLEIYTLFKLPDSTDEVDARLKILMPEPTELKLLHHFSHFTTFEKVMKHDEVILNLPQAIDELMTLLNKDELHLNSLKKAIGK